MNTKTLLAALVGGIAAFLLGWLLYGLALADFYESNTTHYEGLMRMVAGATPAVRDMVIIFLSNCVWALMLAYVFTRWAGIDNFMEGMKAGAILSFLIALAYNLSFLAFMNLYSNSLFVVDVIVNTIVGGIIGGVVGWMLGRGKATTAAAA